ncbi:hypothetical protein ACLMJK_004370 [Lecanora helva]
MKSKAAMQREAEGLGAATTGLKGPNVIKVIDMAEGNPSERGRGHSGVWRMKGGPRSCRQLNAKLEGPKAAKDFDVAGARTQPDGENEPSCTVNRYQADLSIVPRMKGGPMRCRQVNARQFKPDRLTKPVPGILKPAAEVLQGKECAKSCRQMEVRQAKLKAISKGFLTMDKPLVKTKRSMFSRANLKAKSITQSHHERRKEKAFVRSLESLPARNVSAQNRVVSANQPDTVGSQPLSEYKPDYPDALNNA